jgi:hypothetical protein
MSFCTNLGQITALFGVQFNLQLLYLPGLKNVIADCLTYPQPTGSVATTMAADPVGFEEMVAEQNR